MSKTVPALILTAALGGTLESSDVKLPPAPSNPAHTIPLDSAQLPQPPGNYQPPPRFPQPKQPEPRKDGGYLARYPDARQVVGLDVDPLCPSAVFNPVLKWMDKELAKNGGKLKLDDEKAGYNVNMKTTDVAAAIDITRALTRNLIAARAIEQKMKPPELFKAPGDAEIEKACVAFLEARKQVFDIPIVLGPYLADAEDNGRSFGTSAELKIFVDALKAFDFPVPKDIRALRTIEGFLSAVADTPPLMDNKKNLVHWTFFNGHGAPGGDGLSALSDGAARLSKRLMTHKQWAKAWDDHFEKHKDMYKKAKEDGKTAVCGTFIAACHAQDFVRDNRNDKSYLAHMQRWSKEHNVICVAIVGNEAMKPGYYQPRRGLEIPVIFLRAVAEEAKQNKGKLTVGSFFPELAYGRGVDSNVTMFVTFPDGTALQIGMADPVPHRLDPLQGRFPRDAIVINDPAPPLKDEEWKAIERIIGASRGGTL